MGPSVLLAVILLLFQPAQVSASAYNFLGFASTGTLFAVDPDLTIRRMNPRASDRLWTFGDGWGFPPFFYRTSVPGQYERADFFYPFGLWEESTFRSRFRFTPFFESRWSKAPPFDGFSRCLTIYQGRSDLGDDYWGVFPFYGFNYRRYGVDHNFFLLFPLYYESTDEDARTMRFLWPFITYADSPGRKALKFWPFFGRDEIRNEYFSRYVMWPIFQNIEKHPGTEQASCFKAQPFPLYMNTKTCYDSSTDIIWPFFNYYHHRGGHTRYTLWPFFKYGSGGGIEQLNLFYVYSYKKDLRKGTSDSGNSKGYVTVEGDEVYTERKFLLVSTIQKRYRKGCLVFSRYRFWPFAEYTWDLRKGSHLKIPEILPLKNDWFDVNLGRVLRFVDFRDTPITREFSYLFGLRKKTQLKTFSHINPPPKPGEDNWEELISGAFGNR